MFTDDELKILRHCVEKERNNYIVNGVDYMDYFYKLKFKSIMDKLEKDKLDKNINNEMWVKLP